ncbi:MBL fold metallo-hydrolase [Streptomyces sp. NPDC014646]|uniref:MBL fold metallo-hydrolase n=1 Tax=Streptomyces sp. NPDC014646 TaxID=3364877 RepID=UPI0036F5FAA9
MDTSWEEFGWERIGHGTGRRRLPGWDATTALVAGAEGVLLVDTGSTLREGAGIRDGARALLGREVTHIALTHPHFDHVLGTAAFPGVRAAADAPGSGDVRVYGAAGTADLLRSGIGAADLRSDAVRHGVPEHEAARAVAALVAPDHEVRDERTVDLGGGRRVLLANLGPAHSGHDLVAVVPGSPAVVFCGDLVEESGEPQAGPDAAPARWPAALDRLLALGGEDAVYVPGHGAVVDAAFVREQRDRLAALYGGRTGP